MDDNVEISDGKLCLDCKEVKPCADFYKNRANIDGLGSYCKPCHCARTAERTRRRLEEMKANDPAAYAEFVEKRKNRWKQRMATPNGQASRERHKEYVRQHYQVNKERYYTYVSARKARLLGSGGSHSCEAWRQMLDLFGSRCLCCGRTERITKDHVVPITRGGTDDITNLQPLCIWCNKSKFTRGKDFRTQDKVVLAELNSVGRLLFGDGQIADAERGKLKCHEPASRYTGVYYAPKNAVKTVKPWRAIITVSKRRIDLGRYATSEEAALAYNDAAREYLGDRACMNEVAVAC